MQCSEPTNFSVVVGKIEHFPLKRFFDICFSVLALVALIPLFTFLALFIKVSSKGPIFFSQWRIGRGGKLFRCYKFRSMYLDAEERLDILLANNQELKSEWQRFCKLKKDPRVTPFGKFLRRSSLDELPQFWNVIKGDLSVVGPRPVTTQELKMEYGPYAEQLVSIRPGLTGPWQVSGRNHLPYPERIRLDVGYVQKHSFWGDVWLIIQTIPAMISTRGAY